MQPFGLGDEGPDVLQWQKLLQSKGFVVAADGKFGRQTRSATMVAQHWAGVTADGIVGPRTWRAVRKKQRTRRPVTAVRHTLRLPGWRPKIIDVRGGKHGFPRHLTKRWGQRAASEIVAKLGHYTGGPASFVSDAYFHVHSGYLDQGGAPAIAYHLGVDTDGTLYVFNNWADICWHCDGGHNTDTLGVVFRGGTPGPTLLQRLTLAWLWKQLDAGTFTPAAGEGRWPRLVRSTTHRHVNATTCPGVKGERFYRSISPRFETRL